MGKDVWRSIGKKGVISMLALSLASLLQSCNYDKSVSFPVRRYTSQVSALLYVAANSKAYASDGLAWSKWKDENTKLFEQTDIIKAEVLQVSSVMSLLVKQGEYEILVFYRRKIPRANEIETTNGYATLGGESFPILEYLQGIENGAQETAVVRLVIRAPSGSENQGPSGAVRARAVRARPRK